MRQSIVVEVTEGQVANIPNQIEGIEVIVRPGQPVTLTATTSRSVVNPGGRLLIGGHVVASIAGLAVGANEEVFE